MARRPTATDKWISSYGRVQRLLRAVWDNDFLQGSSMAVEDHGKREWDGKCGDDVN